MDLGNRTIHWKSEDGYTLLETVVAMALFLAVLIPLMVMIGNFVLDRTPEDLREALRIAQSEMSRIENGSRVPHEQSSHVGRFTIETSVKDTLGICTVQLSVRGSRDMTSVILTLEKAMMRY